ncbi:hypothetical protein CK203_104019 [Vitis vinifera]|uniref:Uncharacterized protein n=1 Tax=Vitis vinifera TaxID=29760 RepID=A0A438FFR4_VITVI|nr:hypothetical protein CK203_104019 [Vitis vinifera]
MSLRKRPSFAKSFRNSLTPLRKFSQLRNQVWHTSATSQHRSPHFAAAKLQSVKIPNFAAKAPFAGYFEAAKPILAHECHFAAQERHSKSVHSLPEPDDAQPPSSLPVITSGQISQSDMGEPEEPNLLSFHANESARGACSRPTSEPPRPKLLPPAKPAPQNPPARRYLTRALSGTIFGPSSSPRSSGAQPPLSESQIPSGIAPEPPSNCPELADSFHLLRRYHGASAAPRDFFYPRVAMDFYQSMTTKQSLSAGNGSYLVQGASTIHIYWGELPPSMFLIDALLRHNISTTALDSEERSSFRGPVQDFEGYFFGPHHLIMAALLYFEEKILEHLGYPSDPQLERKRIAERAPPVTPASSEPLLQLSQGWPFPFQSIEIYAAHCRPPHLREPCSGDGSYSSMPGADVDHPGSAHCHLEAAPASSRSSISC